MGPARKYTPQEYAIALKELHGRYEVTLKEMTNSFPYAKAYPELDKYTSLLEKDQSSLNAIKAELFLFRDSIEQDITSVADEIEEIIEKIEKVEKSNAKLMLQLTGLDNEKEGAIGMYDDSRALYNYNLAENWLHFFLMSGLGYAVYRMVSAGRK